MSATPANPAIHPDLESVLVSTERIRARVAEIGRELKSIYGEEEFTIVAAMNGAILFTADLLREVDNPIRLDCIRISSYGPSTVSRGTPKLIHGLTIDVTDRHVLIVDDILDTGKTLALLAAMIRGMNPKSVRTCVLLDKKARRTVPFEADIVGFEIPDKFVVGYGLDFSERYRNLQVIGILKQDKQKETS